MERKGGGGGRGGGGEGGGGGGGGVGGGGGRGGGGGGGGEPHLPYNRPPLSKKYLAGEMERERLLLRSAQFYQQHLVEVKLGLRVTAIDRADQRLRLSDGAELRYDKLILCLGSRNRLLEVPGCDLKGCLLYTSPSPRDRTRSRMPSSA